MKTLIAVLAFVGALFLTAPPAAAQAGCKYITNNTVLTAGQWNFCFKQKQDVAAPNAGTWVPLSSPVLASVTSATWQKVGIQTCVNATFVMPTVVNSAIATITGLPFPAVSVGQMGKASGTLYTAISASQFTFLAPNTGSPNPTYIPQTYTQMSGLHETVAFCYS